jgi:predicted Zn-dependent protease
MNYQDKLHFKAAQGWLEISPKNWAEAQAELDRLTPETQSGPEFLKVSFAICAGAGQWGPAALLASKLCELFPDDRLIWCHYAEALSAMKMYEQARDVLLPIAHKFPDSALIRLSLACYTCRLGDLVSAKRWLEEATARDGSLRFELIVRGDPALQPLWAAHDPIISPAGESKSSRES